MKLTLSVIDNIINNYETQVGGLQKANQASFATAKEKLLSELQALQLEDPLYIPYSLGTEIDDILKSISSAAESRDELNVVYAGGGQCKLIQGVCIDVPWFTSLVNGFHVLIKPFNSNHPTEIYNAEYTLRQYLLHVLLAYPRGAVRVNFIDPDGVDIGASFMPLIGQSSASVCRLLKSPSEIEQCLVNETNTRIEGVNRFGSNYYVDNPRYEMFVMVNYPASYQSWSNQLDLLLNRGKDYGIQFVVLHDINTPIEGYNTFDLLSRKNLFTTLDNNQERSTQSFFTHIAANLFAQDDVFEKCLLYLKNGLKDPDEEVVYEGFTPLPEMDATATPTQYFAQLEDKVSHNLVLPVLRYNTYDALARGQFGVKPNKLNWQANGSKQKNIVINYTWKSESHAIDMLNQIAMQMLISLPVTKLHFTLINYNKDPWARFLDKNIDDRLVDVIYDERRVPALYAALSQKMEEDSNQLGCSLEQKNIEDKSIYRPYEVVVMNASDANSRRELMSLFRNGADSGIYFIVMNNTEERVTYNQSNGVLDQTPFIQTIDADVDFYSGVPIAVQQEANLLSRNKEWMEAATRYINERSVVKINHDWDALLAEPYPANSSDMSVVIGYEQDTGAPVEFKLDISHSHYHSFVIGGTGSGKTSFLHNLIVSLAVKYKPEDLELYLLDLKGPEFGRYKQLKQSGAVLVDKTDDLITYEVVSNLERKMLNRKELFTSGGDLASYNKMHPEAPLPQVLLAIDECQNLYKSNSENHELSRKIVDVITRIATEGRAFGIHLLMATQSLNNCPLLDPGVLNQFQDFYILPCVDADAKMLVKQEYKEQVGIEANRMEREKEINRGQCFLCGTDGNIRFKFNYVSDEKHSADEKTHLEQLIEHCVRKSVNSKSNGQVFFSGSQNYSLYDNLNHLLSPTTSYLVGSAGQNISFAQEPNQIYLPNDQGQNILTIGYNDKHFVTRASIGVLLSLILSSRKNELAYRFIVINCLEQELKGAEYVALLKRLADAGYIELVDHRDSADLLKSLCGEIYNECARPTILSILSQERYTSLKNNDLLSSEEEKPEDNTDLPDITSQEAFQNTIDLMGGLDFSEPKVELLAPSDIKTYRQALTYILQQGPAAGVHTLLQINKASELALDSKQGFLSMDSLELYKMFSHILFLQTDKDTEMFFSLYDLHLSTIQEEENRLRAYYYKADGGSSQLISPYILPTNRVQKTKESVEYQLDIEAILNELIRNY